MSFVIVIGSWGRRRNATNWSYNNVPTRFLFERGYTGHEHLDKFSLINMNGRVYDPWLGRMLSPDPFLQAPAYSQNYNRYSYAFNNPLKYTDPSGYNSYLAYMQMYHSYEGTGFNYRGIYYSYNATEGYFSNSSGNVANSGGYHYNWSTGQYMNGYGQRVSFAEAQQNYINLNSSLQISTMRGESIESINSQSFTYTGTYNDKEASAGYGWSVIDVTFDNIKAINNGFGTNSGGESINENSTYDGIMLGFGLESLIVGIGASGTEGIPVVSRTTNILGGIVGTVDNSYQSYKAFSNNYYYEGTYQAIQATAYLGGTILLFTPLMPIGGAIILTNSVIDIGEYYYKNW